MTTDRNNPDTPEHQGPSAPSEMEAKLAAFAFDELDVDERQAVEADLQHDEAAQAFVEEMRSAAQILTDELAREPEPEPLADLKREVSKRIAHRQRLRRKPLEQRPLVWVPLSLIISCLLAIGAAIAAYLLIVSSLK